jgi:hypothetical protein
MGLTEFVNTFYRKIGNSYFSLYDLSEIGFAVSDAGFLEPEELHDSYDLFINDRKTWLDKYAWSDDVWQKANRIGWLKPFIEE